MTGSDFFFCDSSSNRHDHQISCCEVKLALGDEFFQNSSCPENDDIPPKMVNFLSFWPWLPQTFLSNHARHDHQISCCKVKLALGAEFSQNSSCPENDHISPKMVNFLSFLPWFLRLFCLLMLDMTTKFHHKTGRWTGGYRNREALTVCASLI